ncbi:uncharacterized protein LOC142652483 [Rhinoderma darwinii]|uniref:uncharacterized protein LOC142652483 n=1 Tax=Rhinoderma darwinii TaxID=43563 RepID=UPI003F67BDB5
MPLTPLGRVLLAWMVSRRFGERRPMLQEGTRRRGRIWVHPLVAQRTSKGHFHTLYEELRSHPEKFRSFCRMSVATFDILLVQIRTGITYKDTNMRRCISPEERLLVTLRFLATGNSYHSLHFEFLLGVSTISAIVTGTCVVLWLRLKTTVMPQPTTDHWLSIASDFNTTTQFPNCIGALDGKHIRVKKPPHSGSRFYNYKQFFSIVLLALSDSNYCFTIVHIGSYGSSADARIFRTSRMGHRLMCNLLSVPVPNHLPGSQGPPVPYVIVADEGFGLTSQVMRPFARRGLDDRRRIFNYRLSRARRCVECAFGIMSSKWRVFLTTMQLTPQNVTRVVMPNIFDKMLPQQPFRCHFHLEGRKLLELDFVEEPRADEGLKGVKRKEEHARSQHRSDVATSGELSSDLHGEHPPVKRSGRLNRDLRGGANLYVRSLFDVVKSQMKLPHKKVVKKDEDAAQQPKVINIVSPSTNQSFGRNISSVGPTQTESVKTNSAAVSSQVPFSKAQLTATSQTMFTRMVSFAGPKQQGSGRDHSSAGPSELMSGRIQPLLEEGELPQEIKDQLYLFMATVFPNVSGIFQQNNAPYHTAKIIQELFEELDKEFKVLTWSPNSPISIRMSICVMC